MNLQSLHRRRLLLLLLVGIAGTSGCALAYMAIAGIGSPILQSFAGIVFTLSILALAWIWLDPDTHAARRTDELLQLASQMLDCTKQGLTTEAAQHICELLLPATPAIAVAITDRETIVGYAGYNEAQNKPGSAIRTIATHQTIEDGKPRVLHKPDDIGLPSTSSNIHAAIVQPLYIGSSIEGTLKFYYGHSRQLNKTQESLAQGFAELLSTQMAASALEEQIKLTTSMELKALQAQINPHFLFNTLNTIASLIRTDPAKARVLVRDFSAFYRSTLEDSQDLIPLRRELKQVERYVSFEVARFGEERLELIAGVDPRVMDIDVPSFMIQPLVENAVKHAMRAEGKLTVTITGVISGDDVVICVIDDGSGMDEETLESMMEGSSETGLGLAVRNVRDRMKGYFGPDSTMEVKSALGRGTAVCFTLSHAMDRDPNVGSLDAESLALSVPRDLPRLVVNE